MANVAGVGTSAVRYLKLEPW